MKKWDFVIIGAVVILSLLPLLLLPRAGGGARVTVAVAGETVYAGGLFENAVVEAGGGNTVTVQNGRVRMTRADCPDGLCLRGEATGAHPLVCLPNRVVVTVSGGEAEIDGVTY